MFKVESNKLSSKGQFPINVNKTNHFSLIVNSTCLQFNYVTLNVAWTRFKFDLDAYTFVCDFFLNI